MKRIVVVASLVGFLIAIALLSLYSVSAGEVAVVTQFGKPVATVVEPGLKVKLPGFLQRVNRFDARSEVFSTQPIQLLLGDKNPIIMTTYVAWRISDPLLFFRSLITRETAREKLGDMVVSTLGSALADYTLDNVINPDPQEVRIAELEERILEAVSPKARARYGVDVLRLGIRRIAYPSIVAEAVYNRMRAEREKEARKYRAEGTQAAAKIEAATDKDVSAILAEAYKESEILKGQGDQEAARIYAEAYAKDPELFEFLRSLDLYRATFNKDTTLILSTESDLFRYLESAGSGQGPR